MLLLLRRPPSDAVTSCAFEKIREMEDSREEAPVRTFGGLKERARKGTSSYKQKAARTLKKDINLCTSTSEYSQTDCSYTQVKG